MSKTALTFEEKIITAYLHYVHHVDQHVIATAFTVNPGRIAEACVAVRNALQVQNVLQLPGKAKDEDGQAS